MKRTFQFLACVAIGCAMMVSCKNTKNNTMSAEEAQAQKIEYGEEILAVIDSLVNDWVTFAAGSPLPINLIFTEKEKMVKPDYFFDPKNIDTLVTRDQKVCALAMLMIDRPIILAYDMPVEETDAAIAKLVADVNFPVTKDDFENSDNDHMSQVTAAIYESFKAAGDLYTFWLFHAQAINEIEYIIAQNPELYLLKVPAKDWKCFNTVWDLYCAASKTLAPYDPEMAKLYELLHRDCVHIDGYTSEVYDHYETAIPFYHLAKDQVEFRRNNMLNY